MWLVFSIFYALFDGFQNTYFKHTSTQVDPVIMAWSVLVISGLCYSPLLLLGIPTLNAAFWVSVVIRLIIDSFAFTLFIKGVQKSPLSLTIPMMSIGPVLVIVTGFFINHLLPSPLGIAGVLLTVVGLYFLNFDHDTKHILSPFKAVVRERGVLMVTIAAVLWSVVSSIQKLGIDNSSVYFYTAFFQILWAICFTPVAFFSNRQGFKDVFKPKMLMLLIPGGAIDAIKMLFHNLAYSLTLPAYVNSIGNTSILFSSFMGAFLFKEKIKDHVAPIVVIFIGITLIVLGER